MGTKDKYAIIIKENKQTNKTKPNNKKKTNELPNHKTTTFLLWPSFLNIYKTFKDYICLLKGMFLVL